MTDDLLHWAASSLGVGEVSGESLIDHAQAPPEIPDPRLRKSRSRPNRGRKKYTNRVPLVTPPWGLLEATGYPIPRDIACLEDTPRNWRVGPRANQWRREVRAMWGHVCHLCGHEGADSADHLVPLSKWSNQPYDARLSRPAHGVAGCPTCKLKCNSSRGNRDFALSISKYQPRIDL